MKKRIAIVGGGIAGLTAAYLLNQKYDITVFEKTNRIGGNAYTYNTIEGQNAELGAAVFTKIHYPNFFKILSRLNIKTMFIPGFFLSFFNLNTKKGFYITPTMKGLAAQGYEILKPKNIKCIVSIFTGLRKARKLLKKGEFDGLTFREALEKVPQIKNYTQIILISALCLLSSMSAEEILNSPAHFFINKLDVYRLFSMKTLFSLRIIKNNTKNYIEAISANFKEKIVYGAKINSIYRNNGDVTIKLKDGKKFTFDKVIFACHADQVLQMLKDPVEKEKECLGPWKYKNGKIILHSDYSSFPLKRLMGLFTFLFKDENNKFDTSVNGFAGKNLITAQHPNYPIKKDLIKFKTILRTPIFDHNSVPTINKLPSLNGIKNSYYCGSYFGYGLHEDAVRSAIEVAKLLNAEF